MLRLPLAVVCLLLCANNLFAELALTVKDISLMLRSGYSSKAILADLATRRFAEQLDPKSEAELRDLRASPELIEALKNGKHTASLKGMLDRQLFDIQKAEEAERMAKNASDQIARVPNVQKITVVPAQTIIFKSSTELEAEAKATRAAKIEERRAYCEEHPVECEMLRAAKSANGAAQQARSDAENARQELQSLKTSLSRQGVTPW